MGNLDLLINALMAVLKVLLLTAVGSFLALDRVDILVADARKHLNNIVFFVFNPALVGSSLAKSITFRNMGLLWFMPLNILITLILGSVLGCLVIRTTKAPEHLRGLVLGCCAAGNLGNMPLIIIPALCKEKGSPFGRVDVCYTHGLAYASVSMAIGAVYMWTYVYNIMRMHSIKDAQARGAKLVVFSKAAQSAEETPAECCGGPLLPLNGCSVNDIDCPAGHFELELGMSRGRPKVPPLEKIKQVFQIMRTRLHLGGLFAPSTLGAIVGFLVGVIPELREVLVDDTAPLRVVEDSASLIGEAAIPTVNLIVGANLLRGLKGSQVHLPVVTGIILVRYVVLPIFGIVTVKSAVHFGLVQSDPLYQFILLLQYALPPAMSIGTMTQLFGTGESECSLILSTSYALAAISLTFWSAAFMWLTA